MAEAKTALKLKYPHSVARKTAFQVLLLCSIISVALVVLFFALQFGQFREDESRRSLTIAHAAESIIEGMREKEDRHRIASRLDWMSKQYGITSICVVDKQGLIRISTDRSLLNQKFDNAKEGTNWEWPSLATIESLDLQTSIYSGDTEQEFEAASVAVLVDLNAAYWHFSKLYGLLAIGLIISSILVSLAAYFGIRRQVTKRLSKLTQVIKAAEQGSFLVRAKVDGQDEVAVVAIELNKLLMHATSVQVKAIENEQGERLLKEDTSIREELLNVLEELRQANHRLERRIRGQELLMDAANQLGGILNKDALVSRLVSLVRDKLGWPDFTIFLTTKGAHNEERLKLAIASGLPNLDAIRELTFAFGEGITGLVAQNGKPLVVNNLASDSRIKIWHNIKKLETVPDFLKYGSMLSVPMLYQGRVVGVMDFFYPQLNAFDEDDVTLLSALGALVATAVVNADLYEATLELATSDPLTGLLNRRAMERLLDNEVARSQRFSAPLSVLLLDVDNFKAFNDRLGHLLGDEVLKTIANLLKRSVRRVDAVARFGGEEFCVILPQSGEHAAMDVADKLLQMVRRLQFEGASDQPLGHMSISIGIAIFPEHHGVWNDGRNVVHELMRMADAALYEAKRQGRDRAISYSQIG